MWGGVIEVGLGFIVEWGRVMKVVGRWNGVRNDVGREGVRRSWDVKRMEG